MAMLISGFILANMKKHLSKKQMLIRLLTTYEKYIPQHVKILSEYKHSFEYIITKKRSLKTRDIQVVLNLNDRILIGEFFENPRKLKEKISDYSVFFSISNIRIMVPNLPIIKSQQKQDISIENRIRYEYHSEMSEDDFVD
jgi:hypothetical protein